MPSTLPDPRHTQLRTWYDQLTARIEALDRDIGWALTQHERTIHKEHRDVLAADRALVTSYLSALEWDQPLPGPWPPEFKTADLLAAPSPRIFFKSGRCDFYRHVSFPPNYIPRPELLAEVRERLLVGTGGLALTSAIQFKQADVLHGMGGIGKSVLARALCDDPGVQAAFPDGILWVTLGQTPDLTARLREWIEALGGIVGQAAPTLDQLRNTLAEALRDKACLLIVDDAWRKTHLEPFCAGGPRCRLLVTTRDAALVEGLDAGVYPVPVMAPDQAVALLEEWAQGSLAEVEARVKAQIVKQLGYLPLAVRLAGAQLRGMDPAKWLASFDAYKLKVLKACRVETVHDSLEATFALSLDALASADRRLYVALAIFKEDEPTPVVAIARLWSTLDGRGANETSELLNDLADRALLARSRSDGDAVTFHDLLRDFMAAELGEEGRIAAHRALLDAYRKTWQRNGWHTAPDDGYLYDHLAYHLDALAAHDAAAKAELHGLFADQAWLHARVPQSSYLYNGYLADLDSAWRYDHAAVNRRIDANDEPCKLSNCLRYALIRTSINAFASNYLPQLVARAVETGVWPVQRALSLGRLVADPERRVTLFTALLHVDGLTSVQRQYAEIEALSSVQAIDGKLSRALALTELTPRLTHAHREAALRDALAVAATIHDERERARLLVKLIPQLTGEDRDAALQAGLAATLAVSDERLRARALAELAPQLMDKLPEEGLIAAQRIDHLPSRVLALAALVPQLTGKARELALQEGLAASQSIMENWDRADAFIALVPELTGEIQGEAVRAAVEAARSVDDKEGRVWLLAKLVPQLAGTVRESALQTGLATALAIDDEKARAVALAELVPYLSNELLHEGLATALMMRDERARAITLAALASRLTGEQVETALTAILAFNDMRTLAWVLTALAPQLTDRLAESALTAAQAIDYPPSRAEALAALATQRPGGTLEETLRVGLAAAYSIGDEASCVKALTMLAQHLAGQDQERALQAGLMMVRAIHNEEDRAVVFSALAPELSGKLLDEGLSMAQVIGDASSRAWAMAALVPYLTGEVREATLREGLAAVQMIGDEWEREGVFSKLAPQLTGQLIQAGLVATQTFSDEHHRARALAALAPQLIGELVSEGLTVTQTIGDPISRATVLTALVPHLASEARESAIQAVLMAVQMIDDPAWRARKLVALADQLADMTRESTLQAALVATQAISQEWERTDVLSLLAPQLSGELLRRGLVVAQAIIDESARGSALAVLAPKLTDDLLQIGLDEALVIDDNRIRVQILAALVPQLTGTVRAQALGAALAAAQAIRNDWYRAEALASLLPHVQDADSVLGAIRQAMADNLRSNLANRKRDSVLQFIAKGELFAPPILSATTISAIARHIIEICTEWEWL